MSKDDQERQRANTAGEHQQSDSLLQTDEHPIATEIDTQGGSYVQGNVTVGRDFIGRDKITKTFVYINGLVRWQAMVLVIILSGVIILVGVSILPPLIRILTPARLTSTPRLTPAMLTPDPKQLKGVESSKGKFITALVTNGDDLWIGAQSSEGYGLYRLDTRLKTAARLEYRLTTDADIFKLMVDCKGNVWVLVNNLGTLVYRPATGEHSTWIHNGTPGSNLTKRTMFAVASRCRDDGRIEVWLGREGVHTLTYSKDYPTPNTINFLTETQDSVYQNSKTLIDVRALLFISTTQSLWVGDGSGALREISVSSFFTPRVLTSGSFRLASLAQARGSDIIWVGGDQALTKVMTNTTPTLISLMQSSGEPVSRLVRAMAVEQNRVWLSDSCDPSDATCCPLGYIQDKPTCFTNKLSTVRALSIDERGILWIGTKNGLVIYSTQD